ncbi:MAG: L-histidine N(alpha)-methyltransferase [Flavobacteriaceae bacterium]|nr:L-histidine N(alpha)-methyltransferase [Flavobacteriaceae bacterium]
MDTETSVLLDTSFKNDVFQGLTTSPKFLYSKYIYDSEGDKLFREIMNLKEYYLTDCEFEIFQLHKQEISEYFKTTDGGFDLIELGAGDGKKTKILLNYFQELGIDFTYKPIDISENALAGLEKDLNEILPNLEVEPEKGEYFEVLSRLKDYNKRKKVIMVLGSNMGNLLHLKAIEFLIQLKDSMSEDDLLFMGLDQKKEPQIILDAYNDSQGVTEAFNKNLLARINREMDANFQLDQFKHWEVYDPESGTAKSYLVSTAAQTVNIPALNLEVKFDIWETIHTEISQKYDDATVEWLAEESGLKVETSFTDSKNYFKNYIFRKK